MSDRRRPPLELDDTQDDVRTGPLPDVRAEAAAVIARRAERIRRDALEAEQESLPSSEWAKGVDRQLAELAPVTVIAAAARRRSHVSQGVGIGSLIAAAVALYGWIGARGEARAEDRAWRARILEDRLELRALRQEHEALRRDVARLRGELRGLYPFRAAPLHGPRTSDEQLDLDTPDPE